MALHSFFLGSMQQPPPQTGGNSTDIPSISTCCSPQTRLNRQDLRLCSLGPFSLGEVPPVGVALQCLVSLLTLG